MKLFNVLALAATISTLALGQANTSANTAAPQSTKLKVGDTAPRLYFARHHRRQSYALLVSRETECGASLLPSGIHRWLHEGNANLPARNR